MYELIQVPECHYSCLNHSHLHYRIAGNFRGRIIFRISRIGHNPISHENFRRLRLASEQHTNEKWVGPGYGATTRILTAKFQEQPICKIFNL